MDILIANGHLNTGGVEKSLVNFLNAINYKKNSVDLVLFEGIGAYANDIPKEVNVILIDFTKTYGSVRTVLSRAFKAKEYKTIAYKLILTLANKVDLKFMNLLKSFHFVRKQYDCAIAYRVGMPAAFVSYVVKAPKKYVWWHHGEFSYGTSQVNYWKKTFKNIETMVCVSGCTKKMVLPYFSECFDSIKVIPNMLNREEIIEKAGVCNPYEGVQGRILVSVGRLSEEKHMENAIFAMKHLLETGYSDIKWYLIGDGLQYEKIAEQIDKYSLNDNLFLLGAKTNPYPYIKYADLFVHTSYVESQGLSVLEAFALNKVCVVTKSAGTNEFVKDHINAIQADQSVDSLTKKIIEALDLDPSSVNSMMAEQNLTVDRYSEKNIMAQIEAMIR